MIRIKELPHFERGSSKANLWWKNAGLSGRCYVLNAAPSLWNLSSYGRKKEKIAKIVPFKEDQMNNPRELGVFKDKVKYKINSDFEITEEEFLNL